MELRPATREEFDEFNRAAMSAFHREYTDADRVRYAQIDEPERSLAWFEGERIVATTMALSRRVTVPGQARAAVWGFLLDQDLTRAIEWRLAPSDEPLALMLANPARCAPP